MPYRIELARRAESDALEAADTIAMDSRVAASRWFQRLERAIAALDESPGRFAVIPESQILDLTYRSFHHYSHRVIYRIDEDAKVVYVVRVYHQARRPVTQSDLV